MASELEELRERLGEQISDPENSVVASLVLSGVIVQIDEMLAARKPATEDSSDAQAEGLHHLWSRVNGGEVTCSRCKVVNNQASHGTYCEARDPQPQAELPDRMLAAMVHGKEPELPLLEELPETIQQACVDAGDAVHNPKFFVDLLHLSNALLVEAKKQAREDIAAAKVEARAGDKWVPAGGVRICLGDS